MPYISRIFGFTNRHPMLVSKISTSRANGFALFDIAYGARVILSTPPAITRSASPLRIARAAVAVAVIPDAHSRFTVSPGTVTGSPARSNAIRATLRLSSPAWFAQPRITSAIPSAGMLGWRSSNRRIVSAARSSGRTSDSDPAKLPIAVRMPSTIYASLIPGLSLEMVARRAIHGAAKESNRRAIVLAHRHVEECESSPGALLYCRCGQHITGCDRRRVTNAVLHAHGHAPVCVRREREGTVRERERDAAMTHAESIHHLGSHRHAAGRRIRRNVRDVDAEPLAECIARHHRLNDALGQPLLPPDIRAHASKLRPSRTSRRRSALGRYRSSPYSTYSASSRPRMVLNPISSPQASSPRG